MGPLRLRPHHRAMRGTPCTVHVCTMHHAVYNHHIAMTWRVVPALPSRNGNAIGGRPTHHTSHAGSPCPWVPRPEVVTDVGEGKGEEGRTQCQCYSCGGVVVVVMVIQVYQRLFKGARNETTERVLSLRQKQDMRCQLLARGSALLAQVNGFKHCLAIHL